MKPKTREEEIDEMLAGIKAAWMSHPEWRLGQLICNAATLHCQRDPFYVSDSSLRSWMYAVGENGTK